MRCTLLALGAASAAALLVAPQHSATLRARGIALRHGRRPCQPAAAAAAAPLRAAPRRASTRCLAVPDDLAAPDGLAPREEGLQWKGFMVVLTLLWASNFPLIKIVSDSDVSTSVYMCTRFVTAAGAFAAFAIPRVDWRDPVVREAAAGGAKIGVLVAAGYVFQALGLETTTSDKSAFICSLNVVVVSILGALGARRVEAQTAAAVLLAVVGVGVLELLGASNPVVGDLLSLGMPLGFGTGYYLLERLMVRYPDGAIPVTMGKLATIATASVAWAVADAGGVPDLAPLVASPAVAGSVVYMGVVTTAAAVYFESIVFKEISATTAALILTTEPLMAALIAVPLLGEVLGAKEMLGGALIVAGCVLREVQLPTWGGERPVT